MKNKKGFTIVELVIVIAVVAILAAVLIPTFAGIVKKANISADTKAVRNMNVILVAESAGDAAPSSAAATIEILERNGIIDFIPKTESYAFYWLKTENAVVLADENNVAVYPEKFKNANYNEENWFNLAGDYSAEAPDSDESEDLFVPGHQVGIFHTVNSTCGHDTVIPIIPGNITMGSSVTIVFDLPEEMKSTHQFYDVKLTMTNGDSISGLVAVSPTNGTDRFEPGEPVTFDIEEVAGNISIVINIKEISLDG